MNIMDMVIAQDVAKRNRAARSFISSLQYNFMGNVLQIEDVEYEELVPDPGEKPVTVLELVSSQEMYAQPKILKRIPPIVRSTTGKCPNI